MEDQGLEIHPFRSYGYGTRTPLKPTENFKIMNNHDETITTDYLTTIHTICPD